MSSIRTQLSHKLIMLGIFFLGMLLNVHFDSESSEAAVVEQVEISSKEADTKQISKADTLEAKQEKTEVSMASFR
ncbi:MAG: hypothetical protein KJO16_05845 [Muriicola sp.]|nr:hypothetical protein [Muriicola sp.]